MKQQLKRWLPIALFVAAFLLIQNWARLELLIDPIDSDSVAEADVVLYATSWCPYCKKARGFLKAANIPYTEYDIEKSPEAYKEYQRLSGRGVPVLRIGDTVIQGYDPIRIRSAINQLQQPAVTH